jgi:hypothetical protein
LKKKQRELKKKQRKLQKKNKYKSSDNMYVFLNTYNGLKCTNCVFNIITYIDDKQFHNVGFVDEYGHDITENTIDKKFILTIGGSAFIKLSVLENHGIIPDGATFSEIISKTVHE